MVQRLSIVRLQESFRREGHANCYGPEVDPFYVLEAHDSFTNSACLVQDIKLFLVALARCHHQPRLLFLADIEVVLWGVRL